MKTKHYYTKLEGQEPWQPDFHIKTVHKYDNELTNRKKRADSYLPPIYFEDEDKTVMITILLYNKRLLFLEMQLTTNNSEEQRLNGKNIEDLIAQIEAYPQFFLLNQQSQIEITDFVRNINREFEKCL